MGWSGPVTNRQARAHSEWLRERDRTPTLTDRYLMQVALAVYRTGLVDCKFRLKDMELKLEEIEYKPRTKEEAAAASMALWGARLGVRLLPEGGVERRRK